MVAIRVGNANAPLRIGDNATPGAGSYELYLGCGAYQEMELFKAAAAMDKEGVNTRLRLDRTISDSVTGCVIEIGATDTTFDLDYVKMMLNQWHKDQTLLTLTYSAVFSGFTKDLMRVSNYGTPTQMDTLTATIDKFVFRNFTDTNVTIDIQFTYCNLLINP